MPFKSRTCLVALVYDAGGCYDESMSQHIPRCMGTRALLTLVMGELFFRLRLAETQRSPNHLVRACFLTHPDFSFQQRSSQAPNVLCPVGVMGNYV